MTVSVGVHLYWSLNNNGREKTRNDWIYSGQMMGWTANHRSVPAVKAMLTGHVESAGRGGNCWWGHRTPRRHGQSRGAAMAYQPHHTEEGWAVDAMLVQRWRNQQKIWKEGLSLICLAVNRSTPPFPLTSFLFPFILRTNPFRIEDEKMFGKDSICRGRTAGYVPCSPWAQHTGPLCCCVKTIPFPSLLLILTPKSPIQPGPGWGGSRTSFVAGNS